MAGRVPLPRTKLAPLIHHAALVFLRCYGNVCACEPTKSVYKTWLQVRRLLLIQQIACHGLWRMLMAVAVKAGPAYDRHRSDEK
jgi:hypothetical protein